MDSLVKNMLLEVPACLFSAFFIYKMLTLNYKPKYGIIQTLVLYTVGFGLMRIILDMWRQKSEEKLIKRITLINFIIGFIQIFMLLGLIQRNRFIFENNAYMITIISNMVILLGYIVVTEVFGEISRQQRKESEMEKLRVEKQYPYNYYQLAQKQGEEIRDIRHDLRNQLQTIQYMLKFGNKQEEKTGREMLEKLKKRVNHLE